MDEDLIRQFEPVIRMENMIRHEAGKYDDPFDFMFSEPGRLLFAKLGAARIRVAIEQSKVNRLPPTREDIVDAQTEGRDSHWMKEHPEGF